MLGDPVGGANVPLEVLPGAARGALGAEGRGEVFQTSLVGRRLLVPATLAHGAGIGPPGKGHDLRALGKAGRKEGEEVQDAEEAEDEVDEEDEEIWWAWEGKIVGFADW